MQPGRVEGCEVFAALNLLDVALTSWAIALIVKCSRLARPRTFYCGSDDELFPQSSSTGPSCGFAETLSVFFHLMQPGRVEGCEVSAVLNFVDVALTCWAIALIVK